MTSSGAATRTQVGIVGAGPAGLLLSHLLHQQGIDSVVLERRDREYVEARVRAGVLEHGTVQTLREAGIGARMDAEGMPHDGVQLRFGHRTPTASSAPGHRTPTASSAPGHRTHRIDFRALVGRAVVVYGQQEVVKDLIAARLAAGGDLRFEVSDVRLHDLDSERPRITFTQGDRTQRLDCDYVVGADGFHGISRGYLPEPTTYGRDYPFSWLGILAEAPPSSAELIYARHERGFALHSMRSPTVTRMYLQVPADTDVADWPDDRVWAELHERLADDAGFALTEGPLLDKGVTPMRSFVATPMQTGRLFLAGDAAHIVPPTGAKGMNLAIADVRLLSRAIAAAYAGTDLLSSYGETALRRVWRATHFSWWMTSMLHTAGDPFDDRLAEAQLAYLASSEAMATTLAENYTGLPYDEDWWYR